MEDFMKVGYEIGFQVDLYTEFNGYDVLEMISEDYLFSPDENLVDPDYESEELDEDPENIDFHTEGEQEVVLQRLTIDDPFLTKLVGKGNYIGTRDNPTPPLVGKYILDEHVDLSS
ncbi:hypothetical protein Tco_0328793 [Tanacetum coccineum]